MSARVAVLGEVSLQEWSERHRAGLTQGSSPFGVDTLARRGFTLRSHRVGEGRVRRRLRDAVEHRVDAKVDQPLASWPQVAGADLVLALLEQFAVVPSTLRRRGVPPYSRVPLVVLTCWLAEDLASGSDDVRRRWLRRLRGADLLLVLSRHQVPRLVEAGFDPDRVVAVPFGVEAGFFRPPASDDERDLDVVAVGQDRGRDYATLFRALAGTGVQARVVCKPENLPPGPVPSEVQVSGPVPVTAYADLLRRAKVVVVPSRELAYPTGQTVALEAMASGAAVVASATTAMGEYLTDGLDSRLVPVGDAGALRSVVLELLDDAEGRAALGTAARETVLSRFTVDHLWGAVADELRARFPLAGA